MKWGGKLPVHDIFFYSKFKLTNRIIQQTKYTLHWNNISCISVYMCCYVYLISGGWTVKKSFKTKKSLITDMTTATIWSIFFSFFAFSSAERRNGRTARWQIEKLSDDLYFWNYCITSEFYGSQGMWQPHR